MIKQPSGRYFVPEWASRIVDTLDDLDATSKHVSGGIAMYTFEPLENGEYIDLEVFLEEYRIPYDNDWMGAFNYPDGASETRYDEDMKITRRESKETIHEQSATNEQDHLRPLTQEPPRLNEMLRTAIKTENHGAFNICLQMGADLCYAGNEADEQLRVSNLAMALQSRSDDIKKAAESISLKDGIKDRHSKDDNQSLAL